MSLVGFHCLSQNFSRTELVRPDVRKFLSEPDLSAIQGGCDRISCRGANLTKQRRLVQGLCTLILMCFDIPCANRLSCSELEKVTDGRRSFPSGHSSEAWAGMRFLSLFIAGVTGAWCLNRIATGSSFRNSRMARICLTLIPIAWATWVAVSRLEDYVSSQPTHQVHLLTAVTSSATPYRRRACRKYNWSFCFDDVLHDLLAEPLHSHASRSGPRLRKTKKSVHRLRSNA